MEILARRCHRKARAAPPVRGEHGRVAVRRVPMSTSATASPAPHPPTRGFAAASLYARWRCRADVDVGHVAGPARPRPPGGARPRAQAASELTSTCCQFSGESNPRRSRWQKVHLAAPRVAEDAVGSLVSPTRTVVCGEGAISQRPRWLRLQVDLAVPVGHCEGSMQR